MTVAGLHHALKQRPESDFRALLGKDLGEEHVATLFQALSTETHPQTSEVAAHYYWHRTNAPGS